MVTGDAHITDWLQLIRAEYLEIPGPRLTRADALLSAREDVTFLRRTQREAYVRADVG